MGRKGTEPRWVGRAVVDAVHTDMVLTHGGLRGLRSEESLESALARPRQRFAYDEESDLASLAATYAHGIARAHPFADGNKRVAFVTMAVFLEINGLALEAAEVEVVTTMVALAAGTLDEEALAEWVRARAKEKGAASGLQVSPPGRP